MNNDELLEKIRKIVREEVEAEAEKTRKQGAKEQLQILVRLDRLEDRQKDIEISNARLAKGQEELKGEMKQVKDGQQRIEDKLNTEVTDLANTSHEMLVKLDDLPNRVQRLEAAQELLKSKN